MKSPQKKFNPHIELSFLHLILVVGILVVYIGDGTPHPLLFMGLLLSLLVWPVRFFHFHYTKKVKQEQ